MKFSLVVVGLVICGWVNAHSIDSLRTEERDGQLFIMHQVDPGETLYAISKRYKSSLESIIGENGLNGNSIRVGEILSIPLKTKIQPEETKSQGQRHIVQAGETLFGLARKYNVSVAEIKKWNRLKSESLSIGQELSIGKTKEKTKARPKEVLPFDGAMKHYVQFGETLEQISKKRNVSSDSLMSWNNLSSGNLKIGQILWYRLYDRTNEPSVSVEVFGKKVEEGIARQIENMDDSDKYLALHKTLPPGTLLEVRNLMNNKKVFVRVVGQLPSTGLNENVVVRLTQKSFKRLGILDSRARVELTYYDE